MILDKDIKMLEGSSQYQFNFALSVLIVSALFLLFITYNNFSLSIYYAEKINLDFEDIVSIWNAQPELLKQYSGYEVQSLHRMNMAILNFFCSMFIFIVAYSAYNTRLRNKRILETLHECGGIRNG